MLSVSVLRLNYVNYVCQVVVLGELQALSLVIIKRITHVNFELQLVGAFLFIYGDADVVKVRIGKYLLCRKSHVWVELQHSFDEPPELIAEVLHFVNEDVLALVANVQTFEVV